ncbi:cation:proton antiporter subunit C [Corynebacterium felinum]|uniref:Multicomponent Na+:H+ antiporter subunit C n=1 Tax=Corynebacterium felinum TaxID=131318 RepID=A0ABU2B7A5_9CORY|nr:MULTISPECIES: cation:proton antiporter subunit C [Corynebacterium]MDF5821159.1 cation:proton antiporter subunit C [Corynebacterium felinum]MDO4761505.1 cation:proton antiporter subunit C [Corynebacterium sp.]MDR7354485.1 multicomponent Na+:H+ antiporter subunit C [Corynebacterium felinum]WJY93854.1 Na(+)/H(+) antiporter subunit C1 [Corynebacterium felinum]
MILSATIAILAAGGVYLVVQRGMLRIVLGMTLISHAVNLLILSAGVTSWRGEPFPSLTDFSLAADPLPQAFVLTAIVIAMATTTYMLTLSGLGRSDDTEAEVVADEDSPLQTLGRSTSFAELAASEAHVAKRAARRPQVDEGGHH